MNPVPCTQTHRSGFFCTFVLLTFQKGHEMKKIAVIGCGSIGSAIAKRIIQEDLQHTMTIIDAKSMKLFPEETKIDDMIPMKEIKQSVQKSKSKFHK